MNIIKKFFKKKQEEKEIVEELKPQYPLCGICKMQMFPFEKTKKYNKGRYHMSCLRKYKKKVTREFLG